jgi:hypothetical protein
MFLELLVASDHTSPKGISFILLPHKRQDSNLESIFRDDLVSALKREMEHILYGLVGEGTFRSSRGGGGEGGGHVVSRCKITVEADHDQSFWLPTHTLHVPLI